MFQGLNDKVTCKFHHYHFRGFIAKSIIAAAIISLQISLHTLSVSQLMNFSLCLLSVIKPCTLHLHKCSLAVPKMYAVLCGDAS